MDLRLVSRLHILLLVASLCVQSRAGSSRSVAFIDGSTHKYIRNHPFEESREIANSMTLDEVSATVSVLLGFAPSSSLSAESSSKLNEVLVPNPFDKPHAVFMLEVSGIGDLHLSMSGSNQDASIFKSRIVGSEKAKLELPGEDEVSLVPLDVLDSGCGSSCLDEELSNLANWLDGSYVPSTKSSDGELTFPLTSGGVLHLNLAKRADLEFASSLASLVRNIKGAVETHEDLAASSLTVSEIVTGHFVGIQVLKGEYGQGIVVQQGLELFQMTFTKLYDLLVSSYKGKIVGSIIFNDEVSSESTLMVDVISSARASRLLDEATSANSTDAETLLVRRSLAWITGLILLISTLIGIYLLMNMPLTRDTLLYSNVKLD